MEDLNHVQSLQGAKAARADGDPRLVVEEVQDLDRTAVGQLPGGGVKLPGFIRQLGFETYERGPRSLVWLRCDETLALEDAPDGGDRW